MPTEREIKLRFESAAAAREALLASFADAKPLRARRRQFDQLLDTADSSLLQREYALRIRDDGGNAVLTLKGPPDANTVVKVREELETAVQDGTRLLAMLERLGYAVWFRYEKFREEWSAGGVVLAIDETPVGIFLEIEGPEADIHRAAAALGRSQADYVTLSYRALYLEQCRVNGLSPTSMLFE